MTTLFDHIQQYYQLGKATTKSLGAALQKVELQKGDFLIKEGKVWGQL